MKRKIIYLAIALAVLFSLAIAIVPTQTSRAESTVLVDNLQPSWTAPGGGGVFASYAGPPDYDLNYVSPGTTALYDGRGAGIIKAGLALDADGHYWDDGIFGFKPTVTINEFAASTLTYDVENQSGENPVWMTIEIDTGVVGDRADNTVYQFVPTTNPAGWHTVNAAAGQWQKWNDNKGNVTGNPLISLSAVVAAHSGLNVVRAYLRLGMGDSYHGTAGLGTVAWVDKATLGGVTYDFVVATRWYVDTTGSDTNEGTALSPFLTIQHAIGEAVDGDTIHVAAGTYDIASTIIVNEAVTISGPTSGVAKLQGTNSAAVSIFQITASNVTIQNLEITHNALPAKDSLHPFTESDALILISTGPGLSGIVITNNTIYVPAQSGDMSTWNGVGITVVTGTTTGISITGNTIHNTRDGMVVQYGNTATVSGNTIYDTKGGVMNYTSNQADADNRTVSGNSWGTTHNEWDIVWNSATYTPDYHQSVLVLSGANNDAYVLDRRTEVVPASAQTSNRSHIFVNAATGTLTVGAANGNMNLPYATIALGIEAVVPGGTVYVAAGTYTEQVTVNKSLHLIGAGIGSSIIQAPGTLPAAGPTSAIVLISGSGVDAELTSFTVTGPGPSACGSISAGIYVYGGANANIHDNRIQDIRDSVFSGCQNGVAILVGRQVSATTGTATINANTIVGYQKGGIVVDNTGSAATITNNVVTGAGTTGVTAQNGIQISRGATATLSGNTVTGNSFHLVGSDWDWGAAGVLLYQSGAVTMSGGNTLSNNDQNLYVQETTGAVKLGAEFFGPSTAPVDSGYDIVNYGSFDINATSVSFPGAANNFAIEDLVWHKLDDATLGLVTWTAGNLYVTPLSGSIQRGIDAASTGWTVNVAAGTYDEQVVITKSLTLQGAGDTTIIRPSGAGNLTSVYTYPVGIPYYAGNKIAGIVTVENVATPGVTIKDLKVDGVNVTTLPAGAERIAGILYGESAGMIQNVTVNTIKTTGYVDRTYGIDVSAAGTAVSVEVANNLISDFARNGIMANGGSLTANIHDNTITGPGTIGPLNVPNGIVFLAAVNGTIRGNTISACHYNVSLSWRSTGIMMYNTCPAGVVIENNEVYDVDDAINTYNDCIIRNNTLHNNGSGVVLEAGAYNNVITSNNLQNNTNGIQINGALNPNTEGQDPPGTGNVAHNNNLAGNTFGVMSYDNTNTFDATCNWWGAANGPSTVGSGSGTKVSANVSYNPWQVAQGGACPSTCVFSITASVPGGHGSVDKSSQTVNYGSDASINITRDPGYLISGITDNGRPATIANPYVISGVTADHNIVITLAPIPLPTVTSVSPNQGTQRQTLIVTVTGINLTDAASLSFGSGITVNSFNVDSSTHITGNITIGGTATLGARDVSVTTPGGTGTKAGGFTVNVAPPLAPALSSPGNGSIVSATSITYRWNASAGATMYWITVSTSGNVSDASKYKLNKGLGNVIQCADTGYPNNGTTYYWWISAGNSTGWTPVSEVLANGFSFVNGVLQPAGPPSAPTLTSPGNGTFVSGASITYRWNASAGATMYWITVSTSGNVSDASKIKLNKGLGNVVQYADTGYPNNGTTYYWWVSAYNSAGWTPVSEVLANGFSFTNSTGPTPTPTPTPPPTPTPTPTPPPTPTPTPTPTPAGPAAPTLSSPGNGTSVSGTSITYRWNASAGATMYWITVSTSGNSSDMSKVKLNKGLGNVVQYTDTSYSGNGTTYYWWVSAGSSTGWSPTSQVLANGCTFVNYTPPPLAPTLVSPGNTTHVSGASITYRWNASSGATMYWITASTSSDLSDASKVKLNTGLGNVVQYTDTGYTGNGTTYYWWVSAGSSAGGWSLQSQVLANGRWFINGP